MASLTTTDAAAAVAALLAFRQATEGDVDSAIALADHLEQALGVIAKDDAYLGAQLDKLEAHYNEASCCLCRGEGHTCTEGLCP